MINKFKRRKSDNDSVANKWWHWIRPYWHVAAFLVTITFICATKWSNVEAYGVALEQHEKRLTALEIWQANEAITDATTRQDVKDIHEWLKPEHSNDR